MMNADGLTTVGARSFERENYIDWLPIYPWRQIPHAVEPRTSAVEHALLADKPHSEIL